MATDITLLEALDLDLPGVEVPGLDDAPSDSRSPTGHPQYQYIYKQSTWGPPGQHDHIRVSH
jgi:hypothetical protein